MNQLESTPAFIPREYSLGGAFLAAISAGTIFLGLELLAGYLRTDTFLGPAHVTLREILQLSEFSFAWHIVLVAIIVHYFLSILTTGVLTFIIHGWQHKIGIAVGLMFGMVLYTLNFIAFAAFLPGIEDKQGPFMAINYILYGGFAAGFYMYFRPTR